MKWSFDVFWNILYNIYIVLFVEDAGILYEFEGKDIPIMPKEHEHFSEKLNRTSTCSLDQKKEINVSASNITRSGL